MSDEPQSGTDFSKLLSWHLRRGTRPDGSPLVAGRPWFADEFASAVGYTTATVNNWKSGRNRPQTISPILNALFGKNEAYTRLRDELYSTFYGMKLAGNFETTRHVTREELARVASPAPSLTSDGRLDAGPNAAFDVPSDDDGQLSTLPVRQKRLVDTILSGLPSNAPKHLRSALNNYNDELVARGAQPILGILSDMISVVDASIGSKSAREEWLEDGLIAAFEKLMNNHEMFMKYFPLDPDREELYESAEVKEEQAIGDNVSRPFTRVAETTQKAYLAGITTKDFAIIVDKLTEFAVVVASLPPSRTESQINDEGYAQSRQRSAEKAGERQAKNISAKKRLLLSGFGFLERVYNLISSSVTLSGSPDGNVLLTALHSCIHMLSQLIVF